MAEAPETAPPSTTEQAAQVAQTRKGETKTTSVVESPCPGEGVDFYIDPAAHRLQAGRPYERKKGAPLYRPLRILTQDPAASKMEGSIALINVPYEELRPGPIGGIFEVDNFDGAQYNRRLNLDDPRVLIEDGVEASPSNPCFHQQQVYAVCSMTYVAFRSALGRHISWSGHERLKIRPHVPDHKNAWYDRDKGELCFGYYRASDEVTGRNLPGGYVFTCLSHDIVVHETTHALLDGLRAHFTLPSNPDVLAFHEAFADLMAIFQHFSYKEVVRTAIRQSRGDIERAELLTKLATQFARTTGPNDALRTSVDDSLYGKNREPHALGSVLVSAIFEAFVTVFKRKTERYVRLATGGTGVLPLGEMPQDLRDVLADEASQLASQFQTICIRAIDYCPPVDIEFGEYLRAIITADFDLVPDDPWAYREALIDAFSRRKIYPRWTSGFGEDALLWKAPRKAVPQIPALTFAELRFEGDPARPASRAELRRQACALAKVITCPNLGDVFGLMSPGDPRLNGDHLDLPCVHSIRTSRRVGPQGQIMFDLVAEVTQRRRVRDAKGNEQFDYYGGSTILMGPEGDVRFVVSKSLSNKERMERQRQFITGYVSSPYWKNEGSKWVPERQLFRMLHKRPEAGAGPEAFS